MIKAECWSDDKCIEVKFDATEWFKQAMERHIIELAQCGLRGDYPSDNVAFFMADINKEVQHMFDYINFRANEADCGFECAVNIDDAMNWLTINRPHVAKKIQLTNNKK